MYRKNDKKCYPLCTLSFSHSQNCLIVSLSYCLIVSLSHYLIPKFSNSQIPKSSNSHIFALKLNTLNILVIADEPKQSELLLKLGTDHTIDALDEEEFLDFDDFDGYDAIFDLNFENHNELLEEYSQIPDTLIIVSGIKSALAELVYLEEFEDDICLIGINDLPGFINREKAEISLLNESDSIKAIAFFKSLNWPCIMVKDRVGMVTPRIVLMIINEACYTLQEGTAGIEDIDSSMKLGTNYPHGPFEWCDMIGIENVYETLESIYHDTHDERYKVCPLLKSKYLRSEKWY